MKNPMKLASSTAALALAFCAGLAVSQQGDQDAMKRQMAEMLEAKGRPAPEHGRLSALVGTFDMAISMSTGGPAMTAGAVATGAWVLGNRFVRLTSEPAPGEVWSMESISYLGYDKRTQKYFWWGIDNTDTYSVFAEGEHDPATNTLVLYGQNLEPELGGMTRFRTTIALGGPEAFSMHIAFEIPEAARAQLPADAVDDEGFFTVLRTTATAR